LKRRDPVVITSARLAKKEAGSLMGLIGRRSIAVLVAVLALACAVLAAFASSSAGGGYEAEGPGPAGVTAVGGRLLLDGKRFFPIMALVTRCPDSAVIDSDLSIGVTVLDGYALTCNSQVGNTPDMTEAVRVLHGVLADRVKWKELDPRAGYPPTGLPELTTWPGSVTWDTGGAVGVRCKSAGISGPYDTIANQVRLKKTVVLRIPAARDGGAQPAVADCLKDPSTFAEWFWSSIAAGAAGVEYLTQSKGVGAPLFDVPDPIQTQASALAKRLKVALPVILAGVRQPVVVTGLGSVRAASFRLGRVGYVVAVNEANVAGQARLDVAVAGTGSAAVMWEGRTESAVAGTLVDRFAQFGVHIYKFSR
jgi:hypothetical protein